ncbi:MAG: hypothetical protein LC687_04135 [Actinobacteria bacterium]|nr:hypothetical protein [Actinomycetota bacterium]MCA1807024.1 hypothetical protein [Actinomycetota bacterium]
MPTIFNSYEEEALDRATVIHRRPAYIVSVSEDEERVGRYQCRVLPDLLELENLEDCPWYPHIKGSTKDILREGDLVWVYVSKDLQVGFVSSKANMHLDEQEEQAALWTTLTEGLDALEESSVPTALNYEDTYYIEVMPNVFSFHDDTAKLIGYIDTDNSVTILYKDNQIYMKVEELEVHTNLTLIGNEHNVEGNLTMVGDEHAIEGDTEIVGDVTIEGDTEMNGELVVSDTIEVAGAASPATRANEMLDIIMEIENHIHTSPVGPTGPAQNASQAPLLSAIIMFKQTLSSTSVTMD